MFGLVSFVVDVLKAIFHLDHNSLQYGIRFCRQCHAVSQDRFLTMKSDLVHNACVAMPMLLALWSDFELETHHLDVFMAVLILVADACVEQAVMKMLQTTPCFQDDQFEDGHSPSSTSVVPLSSASDVWSTDVSTVCAAQSVVSSEG